MLSNKYQILACSYPRSGNHFIIDLLRNFNHRSNTYMSVFHYSEILRLNRDNLKTITSIRNPHECITSYIVLQNLMNSDFLENSSYIDIYNFTIEKLNNSQIVSEYISFIEISEEVKSPTILFDDLKNKPIEVILNLNNKIDLGLNISYSDIKDQDKIVNEIMGRAKKAESDKDKNYKYVARYPREIHLKPFYKAIRQAVEESPRVSEAYGLYEAYKGKYKL